MADRTRLTLRAKLLLVMTAVAGAALVLSGFVSVWLVRRSVADATRDELVRQADALVAFLGDTSEGLPGLRDPRSTSGSEASGRAALGAVGTILRLVSQVESAEIWRVTRDGRLRQPERINADADLLAGFDPETLDVEGLLAGRTQSGLLRGPGGRVVWVAAGSRVRGNAAGTEGFVFVLSAKPDTDRGLWRVPLLVAGLSALAFATAVSVWFSNRLTRPIRRLQAAAGAIASGDLSARVVHVSADEVGDLAGSFNVMADELERARLAERSFVMSVSHDLRTPLTSIKGYAEAIADGTATGEAATRSARVIETEAGRLERLVHDLLDLARLDAREFSLNLQVADLDADLHELADSFARRAAETGLDFVANGAPLPEIRTDPDRVAQIVGNLLENALRYTPEGGTIRLTWSGVPPAPGWPAGGVQIEVRDTGRGIPPEHLPHVFERLYVAGHVPGERKVGTGLGLAIVSELTKALGGQVTVESVPGEGTAFDVWLPAGT